MNIVFSSMTYGQYYSGFYSSELTGSFIYSVEYSIQ